MSGESKEEDQLDAIVRQIVKETKLPSRPCIDAPPISEPIPMSSLEAPRNKDDWQRSTRANLLRVDSLTRNVFERINANSAAEQAARMAVQEAKTEEKKKQHKKVHSQVKVHQEFIRKSHKCMKEIDHGVSQVSGAKDRLVAERYARYAEKKVCEHRLQLRSKRPGPELVRDDVQRLLEKQMKVLNSRREELIKNEDNAKRMLQDLQEAYESLGKDIGNRRLAMRYDISTISAGAGDLYKSEDINDSRSDAITEKAYKVGVGGLTFCHTCEDLVKEIKRESAAISKQVDLGVTLHTKELAGIKSNLATQIVEAEGAVEKAQRQLKQMEQRAEVGSPMQEAVTQMRALVRDLQANRRNAIEDLRNKTTALDIDNSVRKVTAQVACEDAPGSKKLQGSSSAPSMQNTSMRATGPSPKAANSQGWHHGNPQQGDMEMFQSRSRNAMPSPAASAHGAGASSPLKAAAAASVQRGHGY